jgi:cytochrome b pre-mRNA-processing protein 3
MLRRVKKMLLKSILGLSGPKEEMYQLYRKIVAQARLPYFYTELGVPDSVDGRFELVTLHSFLVLRRLKGQGEEGQDAGQALFDVMFEDMDLSLREMGAGDMGVGKRVKLMVQAFYGRVASYEKGLSGGKGILEAALERNVYATGEPDVDHARRLADYVRSQDFHLRTLDRHIIETGTFFFGDFE